MDQPITLRPVPLPADRGAGKTTEQMKAAPVGAVFVWCNDRIEYARRLAHFLSRPDLKIKPRSWVRGGGWQGLRAAVVVDHAARAFMSALEHAYCDDMQVYLDYHGKPVDAVSPEVQARQDNAARIDQAISILRFAVQQGRKDMVAASPSMRETVFDSITKRVNDLVSTLNGALLAVSFDDLEDPAVVSSGFYLHGDGTYRNDDGTPFVPDQGGQHERYQPNHRRRGTRHALSVPVQRRGKELQAPQGITHQARPARADQGNGRSVPCGWFKPWVRDSRNPQRSRPA